MWWESSVCHLVVSQLMVVVVVGGDQIVPHLTSRFQDLLSGDLLSLDCTSGL